MAASPRKRHLSPRKRLPPTPFNQTWHETDTARLDPGAMPVARIPRAWERKCEVKQVGEGKAKSIWRRFNLRSSIANRQEQDETEEDETEEDDAQSRAVKRRQRMSPKAMEKMRGSKRAFKGTRWDSSKSVLPRKRSAHADEALHEEQSASDDTPDADMSLESLDAPHEPSSFTFAMDAAPTADELPDYESLDEQDDDQKLGNILPEDSTFALIFGSPMKTTPIPSASPAKVAYPILSYKSEEEEHVDAPTGREEDNITVTRLSTENAVEVVANVTTATTEDQVVDNQGEQTERISTPETDPRLVECAQSERVGDQDPSETQRGHAHLANEDSEEEDADMSEVDLDAFKRSMQPGENDLVDTGSEEVTEASLQLDIQDDYELEGELASQPPTPQPVVTGVHDIADGLTLSLTPAKAPSRNHSPKKLHSPPPPLRIDLGPDDATMTLAVDDDTAILKKFLSRAAASKAERSAIITRRSSLENRRDSDVVRHALASPRKALEEMDPNSPTKIDSESTFDLVETLVQQTEVEESASPSLQRPESEEAADKAGRGSRRSSRAKKSRLPAPAAAAQAPATNKIAIRRADGSDPVVLKKTDAQELALITRNNTRKNKQGAFMVTLRLLKIQAEAILSPPAELDAEEKPPVPGRRGIRWDETLAYYQEHADTIASQQAEAESLATPDELSQPGPTVTKKIKARTNTDRSLTPKVRRVKGLGTVNGTPGKGLLVTGSLLPDDVQEEKAVAAITVIPQPASAPPTKGIPKPKPTKKLPVPTASSDPKAPPLDLAPVGVLAPAEPQSVRKSRIAPPKNVRLPKPISAPPTAVPVAEKENKRLAFSAATPRKGIPAPRLVPPKPVVAPGAGVSESALPRRRGRRI